MRRLRDEKKAVFLPAQRCGDEAFVIIPTENVAITNGMDVTVYAKPVDSKATIARFTIGSGKVQKSQNTTISLTRRDNRIQLNDDLKYFVRVPLKKNFLHSHILRALSLRETDD